MYTKKIHQNRIDSLIFFGLIAYGWGKRKTLPNGTFYYTDCVLTRDSRLGFPTRSRIINASKRIRSECPNETTEYKKTYKIIREAIRRFKASSSLEGWTEYVKKLNYNYRVSKLRNLSDQEFLHKYGLYKLPSKLSDYKTENKKAQKDFLKASAKIKKLEELIFTKMKVPPSYRRLNIDFEELMEWKNQFRKKK